MAFSKKTWKDRLAEYAGRRKITNVSTGSSQIVDVERSEGTVSEEGSAFSAANMNDLEQRIGDGFDDVNKNITITNTNLAKVKTYVGTDGKLHFINSAGADTVLPFNRGATVVYLGTGYSFNVTGYSGWQSFTADNFIVGALSGPASQSSGHGEYNTYAKIDGFSITKSYNKSNGVLTVGGYSQAAGCWDIDGYYRYTANQNMMCFAYLIM